MPRPVYGTPAARADLDALRERDRAKYEALRTFLRGLREDAHPAGAIELREGLFRMDGVAGCAVYWEDPAVRGRLTIARVVDRTLRPQGPRA